MKYSAAKRKTMFLFVFFALLIAGLGYVAIRTGPLAPVPVTVTEVEEKRVAPRLFGIGTVEARYSYKIGPTAAGRVQRVTVHVGDRVRAGQLLAEIDPVDLDAQIASQRASLRRAQASLIAAEAQVNDAAARRSYAEAQHRRYDSLVEAGYVSKESAESKRQDWQVSEAALAAARANVDALREDIARIRADLDGLARQRASLRLLAPVDGQVVARAAEPGTTVIAGEPVVEMIDPKSLWINVRFDQSRVSRLRAGLPAVVTLRSQAERQFTGQVMRVEPMADAITEELLAKVTFERLPENLPPISELAEVTVTLPELRALPVVPNASLKQLGGRIGVWRIHDNAPEFAPVRTGASDLEGRVQILDGLAVGDRVVVYSERELNARSRLKIVNQLTGAAS